MGESEVRQTTQLPEHHTCTVSSHHSSKGYRDVPLDLLDGALQKEENLISMLHTKSSQAFLHYEFLPHATKQFSIFICIAYMNEVYHK